MTDTSYDNTDNLYSNDTNFGTRLVVNPTTGNYVMPVILPDGQLKYMAIDNRFIDYAAGGEGGVSGKYYAEEEEEVYQTSAVNTDTKAGPTKEVEEAEEEEEEEKAEKLDNEIFGDPSVITIYDSDDICDDQSKINFQQNNYPDVTGYFNDFTPETIKVNPLTKLTLYTEKNYQGQSYVINNEYTDRYIVATIPENIKSIKVEQLNSSSIENFNMSCRGVFFSTPDIILILFVLLLIWLYYQNQ